MSILEFNWICTPDHYSQDTSFLIKGDSNRSLLVNCGSLVPATLSVMERVNEITDVVLTDINQAQGLPELFLYNWNRFRQGDRINLYLPQSGWVETIWVNFSLKEPILLPSSKVGSEDQIKYLIWEHFQDKGFGKLPGKSFGEVVDAHLNDYFTLHPEVTQLEIPGLPLMIVPEGIMDLGKYHLVVSERNNPYLVTGGQSSELNPFLLTDKVKPTLKSTLF